MYTITPKVVADLLSAVNVSPISLVRDIDEGGAVACTPVFEQMLRAWAFQESMALVCEVLVLNYKVPDDQDP